jgi:hypothetical protein
MMAAYAESHHLLKTPRTAAAAGILFSMLLLVALDLHLESLQGVNDARWTAVVGYAFAAIIILGSQFFDWTLFVSPVWVFVIGFNIRVEEFRRAAVGCEASAASGP